MQKHKFTSYFSYSASSLQSCAGNKPFPHLRECQSAAAVTVPDTGAAGSLSLFFSIVTEVATSSSFSRGHLGDFSSIARQPIMSGNKRQSSYCSVNALTRAYLFPRLISTKKIHLSVPQIKGLPVSGAVLSKEDGRPSWGEVK